MNTNRMNELMEAMQSFGKPGYQKSELLPEMFALQKEMVELTFNGEHASTADLKIWDVENHLRQLNRECGNVADMELQRFVDGSKIFCNLIKAEISGNRGEAKAFRTLEFIRSDHIILKNVELSSGDVRSELDAVVITPGTVTIVEVKNTSKNIFIDENGDYYRNGEFMKLDCNIAEKMRTKEELLRKVLLTDGLNDVQIRSVVVFTDNRIEVQNKYPRIRTCFVSQLAYVIDGFRYNQTMTEEEMKRIEYLICEAKTAGAYSFEFDVAQYKLDFATVMTLLEEASAKSEDVEAEAKEVTDDTVEKVVECKWNLVKNMLRSKYLGYVGSAVAAAAITLISTAAVNAVKKVGKS